uniref:Centromere protein C n=1 Tax=Leptobrachium leishanense TaxID=445787 RepID=A0A8C5LU51_9ANUR
MVKTKELSKDTRNKIVDLHQAGKTESAIGKPPGVKKSTVGAIIRKWKTYKTTDNLHGSGAPRKISSRGVKMITRTIRSKKPYRSRYCSKDQSEGPPAVQPGQNVLNAIKTYFDKTDNVEENTIVFNSTSPGSEASSRISLPLELQGSTVTEKPNVLTSSDCQIEKALGQKTQTPRSAASSSIKKLKHAVHKQVFNCTSESDEDIDPTIGSEPILLAPPEASVDKRAHGFSKLYRTPGSAHHDPASPFAKFSAKKRHSLHSPIVTGYQRVVQQQEELLVNPEEDDVLHPCFGTVQTIDQRRTPIAKDATATSEINSIPDIIQSKSSSRLPSSIPSHAKNVDAILLETQKDSLLKYTNKKSVSTDSSHTFQMNAKDEFALQSISDHKGLTRGRFNQGTLEKKDAAHTFSPGTENNWAYSVRQDVGKNLKPLASPHVMSPQKTPYSLAKDTSKQLDRLYLTPSHKKQQNHIRQERLENNRRPPLQSLLDYLSRKNVQSAKNSYSLDQKDAKSKQSLFLQAATVGHPNKRCPRGSDLPAAPSTRQTFEEDDFSVHEDLNVSDSFMTIPKCRKQRPRQQSKSAFKRSEVAPSPKRFPHCKRGTQISDNYGHNDEEASSKRNTTYTVAEDGNPTFDLDDHSPLQIGSGNVNSSNIDNPAKKEHVHTEHIVLSGENADESTISDGDYIPQKKQTNLHSRRKYKAKNSGPRSTLIQERDLTMTLSKPQPPSVLPNEDGNENLYNGAKENKKKTVRKRVQKNVSSNNVPETNQMVNKKADSFEPAQNVIEGKKTVQKKGQKKVSSNPVAVDVLRKEKFEPNQMVNENADHFEPALHIIEGNKKNVRKRGQKKAASNAVPVDVFRNEKYETILMVNENADSFQPALNIIEETNIPKRLKTAATVKENSSQCSSRRQRNAPGEWWVVKSPVPLNGLSFLQRNIHGHPDNDLPIESNSSKENMGQSGIRKDNKQGRAEQNIVEGGTYIVAAESVAEPLECSPPKTSLGKRKKSVKDNSDHNDDAHSKPIKMPKSIKAKSKSKIAKANNKKMFVDPGEPKLVDPNKGSRISGLQKSLVAVEPKTPANLRSLVTVGAEYEKSPRPNKAVKNMLGNHYTDHSTSTRTPASSAKMVTPVKTAVPFKQLVHSDYVIDFVDGPESPLNVQSGKNRGLKRNPELVASCSSVENAGATRPEENQISCDSSEPLVMPSNAPKLRHSTRTRLQPMQYWRGERVDYLSTPSGGFVINGVISPKNKECIRKPAAKVKDSRKRKAEPSYKPVDMGPVGPTVVLDAATGKQIETECVKISHQCAITSPKEKIKVCKTISASGFSSGKLKLGPLQEKGYQFVCNNTMVFYMVSGAVELLLHETIYHLKTGDSFFVPPGNLYNLTNLLEMEAEFVFCQIKGPPMSVVEEDK